MSGKSLVEEWLELANEDLDVAQYLFERQHRKPLEIICYHCQQSAEKSLKAYLCASDIDVPKTHEVGLLCHRCNELNPVFSDFFDDCEDLEIYATKIRYPNRVEMDEQNAEQALKQAGSIYKVVEEQIKLLFEEPENEESQGMQMLQN